jgi:hypothetical protein
VKEFLDTIETARRVIWEAGTVNEHLRADQLRDLLRCEEAVQADRPGRARWWMDSACGVSLDALWPELAGLREHFAALCVLLEIRQGAKHGK